MNNISSCELVPITELLEDIIDNRGKSCPTIDKGFPLIATNCIKPSSIYPTFENIRYVSDDTLKNWFRQELKPNDILFVNKGTPGRVCLVPDPVSFCAAQDMIGLRSDNEKIYFKYLFAILRSDFIQKKISNFHVGIAIPHFKKGDMKHLLIPVPDMDLQIKIGDVYFNISQKIELLNNINEKIEKILELIFNYWFLQYDFPDKENNNYKSNKGIMKYDITLKREIPINWTVTKLRNFVNFEKGVEPGTKYYEYVSNEKNIPFLRVGDLNARTENNIFINKELSQNKILKRDDIILSLDGTVGIVKLGLYGAYSSGIRKLVIFDNRINKPFLYCLIKSQYIQDTIKKYATGSNILHAANSINYMDFVLPDKDTMDKFNIIAKPMFEELIRNYSEIVELSNFREFIFPLLLSGQVSFKD